MVGYENGKIYKIWSPCTDKIYIGATASPLHKKMYEHRKNQNCCTHQILVYDDCIIKLIEYYPCENKQQLNAREQYYIGQELNCLNKDTNKQKYLGLIVFTMKPIK